MSKLQGLAAKQKMKGLRKITQIHHNFHYPSLRRTLFLALSSSLNAKVVDDLNVFLMDLIFAVNSSFL